MTLKFLIGLFIAYASWAMWRGIGKPTYRHPSPPPPGPARPPVSLAEAEARSVLGVGPDADAEAIRAAHRRLVSAVHPDRGGSEDLTGRINAARDTLLRRND